MKTSAAPYPLTLAEAARITGVSASTLRNAANRLGIGTQIGDLRARFFSKAELSKILAEKRDRRGRPRISKPQKKAVRR